VAKKTTPPPVMPKPAVAHPLDIPEFLKRTKGDGGGWQPPLSNQSTAEVAAKRKVFDVPMGLTVDEYEIAKQRFDTKRSTTTEEGFNMARRWKIVPYDADGAIIQRGVTSIDEGTEQVQLVGKMAHALHRCPKGSVAKIIVNDAADGIVRQWVAGEDPALPEPEQVPAKGATAEVNGEATDVQPDSKRQRVATPRAAKGKGKGKAAAAPKGDGKSKRVAKPRQGGRPGVIATIAELLKTKGGVTIDEIVARLAKAFPDRDADGMRTTAKIQVKRQGAKRRDDEKRGAVWSK